MPPRRVSAQLTDIDNKPTKPMTQILSLAMRPSYPDVPQIVCRKRAVRANLALESLCYIVHAVERQAVRKSLKRIKGLSIEVDRRYRDTCSVRRADDRESETAEIWFLPVGNVVTHPGGGEDVFRYGSVHSHNCAT